MSIVRVERRTRWTSIPNEALEDARLSFRARGVLAFLLSKPDQWESRSEHLVTEGTEGREAIRTALRELEAHGYLLREKQQRPNGQWETLVTVYDTPRQAPDRGPETRTSESRPSAGRALRAKDSGARTEEQHVEASPRRAPRPRRSKREPEDVGLQGDTTALWREAEPPAQDLPKPRRGPKNSDSAWGLARYWSETVLVRTGRLQGRREEVVRKHMAEWKRRGVAPEILRKMVDLFVADPAMRDVGHPWKMFVARADDLHQRAVRALESCGVDNEFGGRAAISADALATIPEHLRARFLEEAGEVS